MEVLRLFCMEEMFIKLNNKPGSEEAVDSSSPVKVPPSFVLSSHRISPLSFLFFHFDVEGVRCSRVFSCPPPCSRPVAASSLVATSS